MWRDKNGRATFGEEKCLGSGWGCRFKAAEPPWILWCLTSAGLWCGMQEAAKEVFLGAKLPRMDLMWRYTGSQDVERRENISSGEYPGFGVASRGDQCGSRG